MASLRVYNTLTKKIEDFVPIHKGTVGLYTCGPTVYNTAHVGNLRTYIFEDILRRTLELNGYSVRHVMNITDVGHLTDDADMGKDKMEESAKKKKKSAYDIATMHAKEFFNDLTRLNIESPTVVLKATETIDLQTDLIKKLEMKGLTYSTSDGIYFDTSKFASYGQLSGQMAKEKKAGARVGINNEKRHPSDFALWKFSKPEDKRQMEWPSPWGVGFPGWHIECSAMSINQFPNGLDIHCGGVDHIAVHHENEIAQNEAAGYKDFVKVWMHGEFLILPGKRMGKSEGNSITLQEIVDKGIDPLAFRYLCLQTHYRKPLSFTWKSLKAADNGLKSLWRQVYENSEHNKTKGFSGNTKLSDEDRYEEITHEALNTSDLNTSAILAKAHAILDDDTLSNVKKNAFVSELDRILGLDLDAAKAKSHLKIVETKTIHLHADAIITDAENLLRQRNDARNAKQWAKADALRKQIGKLGYIIEDTAGGPRLRKK